MILVVVESYHPLLRCKSGSSVVAKTEVDVDGSEVANKPKIPAGGALHGYACLVDLTNTVVSEIAQHRTITKCLIYIFKNI